MDLRESVKLPMHFVFPKFTRYFTLILSVTVVLYALYVAFTVITADASTWKKILPFIIMFFAYDAVHRNLFSLNKISLTKDFIRFSYIAKRSVQINWEDLRRLEAHIQKGKYFIMHYSAGEEVKKFQFSMAFKDMIDIINFIKILAPHIETDEFVGSLICAPAIIREEKEGDVK